MSSQEKDEIERIIQDILKARPQLTREKIEEMIEEKVREFGEIIRRDAAALMLAKELGVVLSREVAPASLTTLKIRDLAAGFRGVDVEGIIVFNSGIRRLANGKRYFRYALADESGIIWGVVWEENVEKYYDLLNIGARVRLLKVSVRKYRDKNEIFFEKNSSIKLVSKLELDELLQYIDKYNPGTRLVKTIRVISIDNKKCILGMDTNCSPVAVLTPFNVSPLENHLIVFSGCREFTMGDISFAQCDASSIEVLDEDLEKQKPFNCHRAMANDFFGFKADVLGYVLFRKDGGRVYLRLLSGGRETIDSLVVSHDKPLVEFTIGLDHTCEIVGARSSEGYYRETPCLKVIVGEQLKKPPRYEFSKFIGIQTFVLNRAVILSWSARVRCVEGKPLFHMNFLFDDGTSTRRGICNDPVVFKKIFAMSPEEACEFSPSTLDLLVSYLTEELQGSEVILKGMMLPGGYRQPLIVRDVIFNG
ncbi:MAG: hypothetical protein ACP5IE_02840 [Infirmifilum sp.]